jgi:hypothetical protein
LSPFLYAAELQAAKRLDSKRFSAGAFKPLCNAPKD